MKKRFILLCLLTLVLSGCETIDTINIIVDSITSLFKEDTVQENSNEDDSAKENIAKNKPVNENIVKDDSVKENVTKENSVEEKLDEDEEKNVQTNKNFISEILNYTIPNDYEQAYSYRTNKPNVTIKNYIKNKNVDSLRNSNPDKYVKDVCNKINEIATNDFEKAKMAHDVVSLLIYYDAKSFWAGTIPEQSWQTVLKNKMGVCEGYANLYLHFCAVLRIPCLKVSGYARGVGFDLTREKNLTSNHAWNIVKLNDDWYLVDTTWDSGYMSGRTSVQSYNTDWLFTKPEVFIYTHYPSDPRKQLIKEPISSKEFRNLPYYEPKFFDCVEQPFSQISSITSCESSIELEYKIAQNKRVTYSIKKIGGSEIKNTVLVEKQGDVETAILNFPSPGLYEVNVFLWEENSNQGRSGGLFCVDVSKGNDVKYPTIYSISLKSAKLISPKYSPLKSEEKIRFEVYVEDRDFVAVIYNKKFIKLENDGTGLFTGEIIIPKGVKKVGVGVSKNANGQYNYLAQWNVE